MKEIDCVLKGSRFDLCHGMKTPTNLLIMMLTLFLNLL